MIFHYFDFLFFFLILMKSEFKAKFSKDDFQGSLKEKTIDTKNTFREVFD